jgi:Tol biopolymer transport system component
MFQQFINAMKTLFVCALIAALYPGCTSGTDPVSNNSLTTNNRQLAQLSDAANGGNAHFYFLAPLVRMPLFTGVFDSHQDPVVHITGPGVDVQFTKSSGYGSEFLRIDTLSECYVVNWHTDQFALTSGSIYRITVSTEGSELGYAEAIACSSPGSMRKSGTNDLIFLKDGRTLPIKFRIEQKIVYVIKPGLPQTIVTPESKVIIHVSEGAVTQEVGITIAPVTDPAYMPNNTIPNTTYDFGPDGLVFAEPVMLTIAYDPSQLPSGVTEQSLVMWHKGNNDDWMPIPGSTVNAANNTVSALISGFSNYSIAQQPPHQIVYTRTPQGPWGIGGPQGEIWVMNADGSGQTNISNDPAANDYSPSFSPVDNRVLFMKGTQVCVMNADGSNLQILNTGCGGSAEAAVWSPDGARVAYRNSYCDSSLHVIDLASGIDVFLVYSCCSGPFTWSPSGTKICFTGSGICAEPELAVVNADGSADPQILTSFGTWSYGATWSPDNAWIAVSSNYTIYRVSPDGAQALDLTHGTYTTSDAYPAWSPDGSKLLFTRSSGTNSTIYVLNVDGSNLTALTNGTTRDGKAVWWPDGSRIIFQSYRDGNLEIYSMNPDGIGVQNLTNSADDERLTE